MPLRQHAQQRAFLFAAFMAFGLSISSSEISSKSRSKNGFPLLLSFSNGFFDFSSSNGFVWAPNASDSFTGWGFKNYNCIKLCFNLMSRFYNWVKTWGCEFKNFVSESSDFEDELEEVEIFLDFTVLLSSFLNSSSDFVISGIGGS